MKILEKAGLIDGAYRLVVRNRDGQTFSPSGIYEEIVPNQKLAFSWKWSDSEPSNAQPIGRSVR